MITASALKIIAMITMFADHVGYLLFPDIILFRVIGRIAFPIYAYLIGEGCRYSRDKKKYFRNIGLTLIAFQIIHFAVNGYFRWCVLLGFLLAVVFSMVLEWSKEKWETRYLMPTLAGFGLFLVSLFLMPDYYIFCFTLPITAYLIENKYLRLLIFGIQLVLLGLLWYPQMYALLAMIPLLLYNGKQGKMRCKTLFYVFYPLHYAILGLISIFI